MKNQLTVTFNNQNYIATYNAQTGYYELELQAPGVGGIYKADINFTDLYEQEYEDSIAVQVLAKEKVKIETNKVFMWIFDHIDFTVKDIVEIANYDINIDEETNANTLIDVLKKTTAKANDIIAIKKNNEIVYFGKVEDIQNADGQLLYNFTMKYITNIFDQDIILNDYENRTTVTDEAVYIKPGTSTTKYLGINTNNVEIVEKPVLFKIEKYNNYYLIRNTSNNKVLTVESLTSEANVIVADYQNLDTQKWQIEQVSNTIYKIKINNFYLTIHLGGSEEGTNIKIHEDLGKDNKQYFFLEVNDEIIIREKGIEDFIAKKITDNFISNADTFVNLKYLQLKVKTHTKKETSVKNVQNNIFNLHTYMTNCTQNYDIVYSFSITNKKLLITIEVKTEEKELIDVNAQAISNYSEVFETDIVSKVVVVTSTSVYTLYLLNDRTTTTDKTNKNRAAGKTVTVYTENYSDARQTALDQIKQNTYNHNITFNYLDKFIKIGAPVAIKTKESLIFDTYISAIRITNSKFIEYTCGNIRVKFIDKLLKERNK